MKLFNLLRIVLLVIPMTWRNVRPKQSPEHERG
jgi:hypothetical protein